MISSLTNRVGYQGDGTSAVFNFQYEFHADADLDVFIWNSARIVATENKVLNTHYSISGVKDAQNRYTNGANVIFNSTPAVGDHIVITRDMAPSQPFNLRFNQVIPNVELVKALDRLALVEQRLGEYIGRGVRLSDSFPLPFDATLPDRLPKNAPIIVNSAGIGMAVGVVAFDGTTAATYFGILPVANGGTGVDFSLLTGIIYSPGNNTTFDRIQFGQEGYVLTAHGSSAPTFDAFAVNLINSGVLSVAFGGTGTGTGYIQYGVVFASSALQMANTDAGGADVPLLGNGAAAPSFRAISLPSNSSVVGILPQSKGGTGTQSSFTLAALIYQAGANHYGQILTGNSGDVLTSNGAGVPASFQTPVAATSYAGRPVQFNSGLTTAQTNDSVIFLRGSSFTFGLLDATLNEGKVLDLIHDGSSFVQSYIISSQTSQLIGNVAAPNYVLHTKNELLRVMAISGNWKILSRYTDTQWINAGPTFIAITGTGVSKPTTMFVDNQWVRRRGDTLDVRVEYVQSSVTGALAGTGDYIWEIPLGLAVNTSVITAYGVAEGIGVWRARNVIGYGMITISSISGLTAIELYDSRYVRQNISDVNNAGAMGSGYYPLNSVALDNEFNYSVPIFGWQP